MNILIVSDCHDKFINVNNCETITHLLSSAYTEHGENGPLFKYEVPSNKPLEANISKVVITGMAM